MLQGMRGLLSSLGAGGSLIAAALAALVLVSGFLAFRDWPGGRTGDGGPEIAMPAAKEPARPATASDDDGSAPIAARDDLAGDSAARPLAVRRAPRSPRRTTAPSPGPTTGRGLAPTTGADPGSGTDPAAGSDPGSPTGPAAGSDPGPVTDPEPGGDVPGAPEPSPGSARDAVQAARGTADPVVDALPEPARPPIEAAGDAAEQAAGTVDETVDSLAPEIAGTLAPVTGLVP